MRVADFFCGAGGFSEGFRQAGFEIVFAIDKWLPAINTFKANKPQAKVMMDDVIRISKLSDHEFEKIIPDTEIIIGSPPCVAFSNSNKSGNGDKELGIQLLEAYLKIVARKKYKKGSILKYWILENVPNIEKYIRSAYTSKDLGLEGDFILYPFNTSTKVYNAKYFGVPSNRKRFLCGEFPMPIETNSDDTVIPMKVVLDSLGEPCRNTKEIIIDCNYPDLELPLKDVSDHQYEYIVPEFEWKKAKRLKQDKGYMGKMSFPENIMKPSRTIMATMSAVSRESMILSGYRGKYRLPTVREIASMMSFPIDYRFYGPSKGIKYTLVGNAVPPKLSNAIAKEICRENGLEIPQIYPRIHHNLNIEFYNLNYECIPIKKEKPKRGDSKFKYHIPYLIIKGYRVELNNYYSEFKEKKYLWKVELHHGQGKEIAKVFYPQIKIAAFNTNIQESIINFLNEKRLLLCSSNEFQLRYCMTNVEREGMVGPYELLESIRLFIDNLIEEKEFYENIQIEDEPTSLPCAIAIGYYILQESLKIIGGIK